MSNLLYDNIRGLSLTAGWNWSSDTIKAYLSSSGYTANAATHTVLTDFTSGARVAGPVTLGTKTTTGGSADAADVTFTAVSGSAVNAIVITDSTLSGEALVAYIDTATGLPITPNGGDIIVTWDNGTNKIFRV